MNRGVATNDMKANPCTICVQTSAFLTMNGDFYKKSMYNHPLILATLANWQFVL